MNQVQIMFPASISVGTGCSSKWIGEALKDGFKKIVVVSTNPIWDMMESQIAMAVENGLKIKRIDYNWPGEPTTGYFETLRKEVSAFGPEVVVGIGGGSVLDVSKLLAALSDKTAKIDKCFGNGNLKERKIKLFCVPTTAGTGSEVSPNAILLNDANGEKTGIISPELLPDFTLVDPDLTLSLPPKLTAETGMDALCHCIEAYMNKNAHPVVDTFALRGIVLIYKNLVKAVRDSRNRPAREAMAMASLMGGLCLGPVNTCGVHALSYGLAGKYHLPHGLANAVLLPEVMRFNKPNSIARFSQIAKAIGLQATRNYERNADLAIEAISALSVACGIPQHLSELDIKASDIPEMADMAMNVTRLLVNNPREITREDVVGIYEAIY